MDKAGILYLFYHSFGHSQGRLILQVDIFSYIAAMWREQQRSIQPSLQAEIHKEQRFESLKPPFGHQDVDSGETVAQFYFWWDTMWDIFRLHTVVRDAAPQDHVTVEQLQRRSLQYSGESAYFNNTYSSLRPDKMQKIADRITLNDPGLTARQLLADNLLPNIISVETYFQGEPRYSKNYGRERTDGGDRFESRLFTHCLTAHGKRASGKSLNVFDELYLAFADYLDELLLSGRETELGKSYKRLVELYNQNHPGAGRDTLHRLK